MKKLLSSLFIFLLLSCKTGEQSIKKLNFEVVSALTSGNKPVWGTCPP